MSKLELELKNLFATLLLALVLSISQIDERNINTKSKPTIVYIANNRKQYGRRKPLKRHFKFNKYR